MGVDTAAVAMQVTLGRLVLPNPVTTGSGCFGWGKEAQSFGDITALGAITAKSVSLEPRLGNATPRMAESPAGMINAIGLQNPSCEVWLRDELPWLERAGARVILSLVGKRAEDYRVMAKMIGEYLGPRATVDGTHVAAPGLVALEINLSCPNVEERGQVFACHTDSAAAVCQAVRQELPDFPLLAKLSPDVTSIADIAGAVMATGMDGVTAINTTLGMAIDPETGRPRIGLGWGGMSGPALRPVAVRCVYQISQAHPEVPIVALGGVRTVEDAVEMLRAGATMVGVGTAVFSDPARPMSLVDELHQWCARRGVGDVNELTATVQS